jgi:Protein of unknown function (DUF2950)
MRGAPEEGHRWERAEADTPLPEAIGNDCRAESNSAAWNTGLNNDRENKSMKIGAHGHIGWIIAGLLAGGTLLLTNGCTTNSPPPETPAQTEGVPAQGQPLFDTDEAAMNAMLTAVKTQDHDQVHLLLGPAWKELVSGDKVEDANAFKEFAQRASEHTRLEKPNDSTSIIHVGNDDWPLPIPLTKTSDGKWFFDTEAGKTEILARRIGENELDTIEVCHEYVKAQHEYAGKDRDGSGVLKYAQRIASTPGKMDGLYWPATSDQEQSPFGPLYATAATQGYDQTTGHPRGPYNGYRFRVLKRQGWDAPGGKYDYVINGNMIAGFALVAFPADYGTSGIMTFIVNQQGKVYQKDLGPDSTKLARQMTEYNPDSSWTLVKD